MADCSSILSREHYISESLLQYLNQKNDLTVSGFPWVKKSNAQVLGPKALAAKVLCERHNFALSPLDTIAVRLFQAFDEEGATGSGQKLLFLFSGHDLERWLLKILCGITCSQNLALDGKVDISIPKYWLDILFGDAEFPNGQGLYVCKSPGHYFEGPRGLKLQVIAGNGQLTGMGLWVCGYELVLSMSGFPSRSFDGRKFAYRPLEFYTTGQDFEKSVVLSWVGDADLGTISSHIGGTHSAF
ncbi:MAG: hypothetical protein ACYS8Z_00380 [Planctomycetota bacterium]